jgi:hypothetical protein
MNLNLSFAKHSLAVLVLLSMGCADAQRPTVRIGVGMPVRELIARSTYPFAQSLTEPAGAGDCAPYHWTITEPYDLVYVHGADRLERQDIGGRAFLLGITAFDQSSDGSCRVDTIRITAQNRRLAIDEALEEAQRVESWLVNAGFRAPTESERVNGYFSEPYSVEQARKTPPLQHKLTSIGDVRSAFLDPRIKVKKVVLAQLISPSAGADIWIENARRSKDEISGQSDENNLSSETAYYLYIDLGRREDRAK